MEQETIDKYRNDPSFHKLVDTLTDSLLRGQFSAEEILQAVGLAIERFIEHKKEIK
jgi:hypothetical protein